MPSLVICDDSADYRYYLRLILKPYWDVVGVAEQAREAFDLAVQHQPDVVSLDYFRTGLTPSCVERFRAETQSKVVVLTGLPESWREHDLVEYRVDDVLSKELDTDGLLEAFGRLDPLGGTAAPV